MSKIRKACKYQTSYRSTRLTDEPTSQVVSVADYENPAMVIDALLRSVVRLALKYVEGVNTVRRGGTKDELQSLHILLPEYPGKEIDANKFINGELFVNALLVEVFARCGFEQLMLDKNKRMYASQLIGKLYLRMFALKAVTKDRIMKLKVIMNFINGTLIAESDEAFAMRMNTSFIPSYLDRCENSKLPCVKSEGLKRMYNNKSTSTLIKYLVMVCGHILCPKSAGVHYKTALSTIPELLRIVRAQVTKQKDDSPIDLEAKPQVHTPVVTAGTSLFGKHQHAEDDDDDASLYSIMIDEPPYGVITDGATSVTTTLNLPEAHVGCVLLDNSDSWASSSTELTDTVSQVKEESLEDYLNNPRNGKNLIDRVMRLLVRREDYFSLDDFNRLRKWAQAKVGELVGEQLNEAARKVADIRAKYYD